MTPLRTILLRQLLDCLNAGSNFTVATAFDVELRFGEVEVAALR
jgi:hypothetical protein